MAISLINQSPLIQIPISITVTTCFYALRWMSRGDHGMAEQVATARLAYFGFVDDVTH